MAAVPGLIAKEGAEGVWAAALPDGRAFASKLSDGGMRALPPVLATVLRHWGFDERDDREVGGAARPRRRPARRRSAPAPDLTALLAT